MGRHRRSAAGRAATGRATGVTGRDGSYTSGYDPRKYSYSYEPPEAYASEAEPTIGIAPYLRSDEYATEAGTDTYTEAGADLGTDAYGEIRTDRYAEAEARSAAYLFASEEDFTTVFPEHGLAPRKGSGRGGTRRKKKTVTPVRTGLLGVSAAVAIGTVAVATGAMPGLDNYKLGGGGGSGDKVQAAGTPTNSATEQGGTSGNVQGRDQGSSTSRDADRSASPSPAPSTSTAAPTEAPTKKPKAPAKKPTASPPKKETQPPKETAPPVTVSAEAAAEAEVLKLVNEERAKVGCSAVSANSTLTELAEAFSAAMAAEGFFDHTDPTGATPWDRASELGITTLGGENIARGQADAAAVMEAWMNSPGHRANILNCDFKTLGVGVHFGSGGPWWTQDFGY
ncbi:CAP domain-containing protein [Streptomyces spinosisporus]|uniref:CAP domain-containing protein n=1 Tax=Streptomyces spinosisporus TaxID=2927582 RepID=A0ABS9XR60_9ACTN|nr:CAP domain-containing protein [Streptomyces spinosisporus]MCI3244546.1 CAP domain-containing protein [Streptomyces spinosisporus]